MAPGKYIYISSEIALSKALAEYLLGNPDKGCRAMNEAITKFPFIYAILNPTGAVESADFNTNKFIAVVTDSRILLNKETWKTPSAQRLLKSIEISVNSYMNYGEEFPDNFARYLIL
jgi:hypothetical protein